MMDRRRCTIPVPAAASIQMPSSSGPRCARLAAIAAAMASPLPPPILDAPTKPAMPHIDVVPRPRPIAIAYRLDREQTMKFLQVRFAFSDDAMVLLRFNAVVVAEPRCQG